METARLILRDCSRSKKIPQTGDFYCSDVLAINFFASSNFAASTFLETVVLIVSFVGAASVFAVFVFSAATDFIWFVNSVTSALFSETDFFT